MRLGDSLDKEKVQYNLSGFHLNHNEKMAMQTLYKNQLDHLVNEKKKQKEMQAQRDNHEKKRYNDFVNFNQQSDKVKEQAYKNYYNMLLNNQEQLQSKYVNPYSIRDTLKDQHIMHATQEGQKQSNLRAMQEQRKIEEKKNMYRTQLRNQLEERKKLNSRQKEHEMQKKEEFRRMGLGRSPNQLREYERMRQLQEMNKYKEDLDQSKNQTTFYKNRTQSERQDLKYPLEQHHPLLNPSPYSIQNPYIKKDLERQNYFARVANQNLSSP